MINNHLEVEHITAYTGQESSSIPALHSPAKAILSSTPLCTLLLFVFGLLYTLPFLGSFEFLRHTEADRTLIAWEMVESNRYLVPHLLGDLYLTKPPLYYWLMAGVFTVAGEPLEWVARLVSAISTAGLSATIFLFAVIAGARKRFALLAALIAVTTAQIFSYSIKAEIDMCYAFLCAAALLCGYLALTHTRRLSLSALTGALLGISFLTKGPPVLLFYLSGVGGYWIYSLLNPDMPRSRLSLVQPVLQQLFSAAIFLSIVGLWLYLLSDSVGWPTLVEEFRIEILQRFLGDNLTRTHEKSWYYYTLKLPATLLPWSLLAAGYVKILRRRDTTVNSDHNLLSEPEWRLIVFALATLIPSLVFLSLSAGKSGRYALPLFPFAALVLAGGGLLLRESRFEQILVKCALGAAISVTIAVALAPLIGMGTFTSPRYFCAVAPLVILCVLSAHYYRKIARHRLRSLAVILVVALVFCLRAPFSLLVAPHQNQQKSARSALSEVHQQIPTGEAIYFLESFERWIPYYLKRAGRRVLRLTPGIIENWRLSPPESGRVYLIINVEDEQWRLAQIFPHDPSLQILRRFSSGKHHFLLLNLAVEGVHHFQPQRRFPTALSEPYGIKWLRPRNSPYFEIAER